MKKEKKCPLCYEKIYSGIGKGCKMCGMQWKMMAVNSAQKNAELSTIMLIKKGAY